MSQTQSHPARELEKVRDTGLALAYDAQDIRGRKVNDPHGDAVGHVSNLFIDVGERKVRMLEIRGGGFLGIGDRHVLVPVDAITKITPDEVTINESRDRLAHSPAYDPHLIEAPTAEYWEPFYGYYGLTPYWTAGYTYPHAAGAREDLRTPDEFLAQQHR
jgi:sporulation protein YlmC with PRC-barrel domain